MLTDWIKSNFDNMRFVSNVVRWLAEPAGKHRVSLTTGHKEWVGGVNFTAMASELQKSGYSVETVKAAVDSTSLSGTGVLIIGAAWGQFTEKEIETITGFVGSGGGLLLAGLGWSWRQSNGSLTDFPMNKIGAPFGIQWGDGCIRDPTNSIGDQPVFHSFYPNTSAKKKP